MADSDKDVEYIETLVTFFFFFFFPAHLCSTKSFKWSLHLCCSSNPLFFPDCPSLECPNTRSTMDLLSYLDRTLCFFDSADPLGGHALWSCVALLYGCVVVWLCCVAVSLKLRTCAVFCSCAVSSCSCAALFCSCCAGEELALHSCVVR